MILLDDIHLTLRSGAGAVKILRGIDLRVDAGETVAITGPSGSGKSSLMMIIGGLERPSAGRVEVAGTDLASLDQNGLARLRRDHVGIVFQEFHLMPTMTALENVALPLELAGDTRAFERAAERLKRVGLGHRLDHFPSQLSGGEQQRVALARAFVADPALILADEPTGNLDRATGEAVIEMMFDLRARAGATLVLITHDPALAARCGRIIDIADGRLRGERAPAPSVEAADA
jgi:putative ABC transport system ATP-binding protein